VGEDVAARVAARGEAVAGEVARLKRSGLAARLKRPEVTYAALAAEAGGGEVWPVLSPDVVEEVEVEVKYEGYIVMAERAAAREAEAWDGWRIPGDFAYEQVRGLSAEALEKFEKHRPGTVGQARRIPGLTPAAFSLLLVALKREGRGPGGGERAEG
jgi:tRNA uridine 5-carboxymethylaminomethyl modification enzyme